MRISYYYIKQLVFDACKIEFNFFDISLFKGFNIYILLSQIPWHYFNNPINLSTPHLVVGGIIFLIDPTFLLTVLTP